MTLKELLDKVDFDSLAPFIEKTEKKHLDSIYGYREAYDILRYMKPAENFKGKARVEWSGEEYGNDQWIGVFHLDDDYWENELAKEIVIGENVDLPLEEIAAKCLWELTFYGFTPEHEGFVIGREIRNKYDVMLDRLEESEWRHQIPRRYRSMHDGQRFISGDWGMKDLFRKRMNRSKRMREHRQEKREKYLESMSRRENNILDLSIDGSSFTRGDLDFILTVRHGTRYDFRSVTGLYRQLDSSITGPSESSLSETGTVAAPAETGIMTAPDTRPTIRDNRLDYILESITRYQFLDLSQYDNAVFCVRYSSRYPISDDALAGFWKQIRDFYGYDDIRTGTIIENTGETEVKAVLLLNKKLPTSKT